MIRIFRLAPIFALSATLTAGGQLFAEATYELVDYTVGPGWEFGGGTITTTGETGALTTDAITDWHVEFASPGGSYTLMPGNSFAEVLGGEFLTTLFVSEAGITIQPTQQEELQLLSIRAGTETAPGKQSVSWHGARAGEQLLILLDSLVTPDNSTATLADFDNNIAVRRKTEIPEPSSLVCGVISLLVGCGVWAKRRFV